MSAAWRWIACSSLLMCALAWTSTATAQDVRIPVQGLLTDAAGSPLDEKVILEFSLYDDAKATVASWSDNILVEVSNGLFTVYLGSDEPLAATLLRDAAAPELSMKVSDDDESLGRWPLGSAPLAAYAALAGDAQTLQGKKPDELIAAGSITGAQIADGAIEADDLKQIYAGGVSPGGAATISADVSCSGCVSETEVSFNYAASTSPAGAASSSEDLQCTGCVVETELDFATATQAELDAHKTSTDHDTQYVAVGGDTMSGVLNLPADGLSVAGNQLLLTGGKVGVGTASPKAPLHVAGMLVQGTSHGTLSHQVASFFTNANDNTQYIHLRTPFDPKQAADMFHFKVTGYAYGASTKIIDITYVGYAYTGSETIINKEILNPNGGHAPAIYQGSDDNVYLRFKPSSVYYLSFRVDSMYVGNGRVVEPGEVTVTMSPAATL